MPSIKCTHLQTGAIDINRQFSQCMSVTLIYESDCIKKAKSSSNKVVIQVVKILNTKPFLNNLEFLYVGLILRRIDTFVLQYCNRSSFSTCRYFGTFLSFLGLYFRWKIITIACQQKLLCLHNPVCECELNINVCNPRKGVGRIIESQPEIPSSTLHVLE